MRWRLTAVGAAAVLAFLAVPVPAHADAELLVSGLRNSPGTVQFYLTAKDMPAGTALDQTTVSVTAENTDFSTKVQALPGGDARVPKRMALLLLDAKASMAQYLPAVKSAVTEYTKTLPADVRMALVSISDQAKVALAPTTDRGEFLTAVGQINATGNTPLSEGVKAASELIRTAGAGAYAEQRILLVSDGAEASTKQTLSALARTLKLNKTPVDVLPVAAGGPNATVLQAVAGESGGRTYPAATDATALTTAFRTAAGVYRSQLVVTVDVPSDFFGRTVNLHIAVTAGGTTIANDQKITFAVDPGAEQTVAGAVVKPTPPWLIYAITAFVFVALLVVLSALTRPVLATARHRRRLAQVGQYAARAMPANAHDGTDSLAALGDRLVRGLGAEEWLTRTLERAGIRLRPGQWALRAAVVCLASTVLFTVLLNIPGLVIGLALGALASWLHLRYREDRRTGAFASGLPDALTLVIGSLRSGFALPQALDAMVKETTDPISTEFSRALTEVRLGADLEDALDRTATRMRSKDLSWTVMAIRIQREVGGNLAEVLGRTVETMRERDQMRRQIKALSAEGRMSAWVLISLPVIVTLLMLLIRPQYLAPMAHNPIGITMLVAALILLLLGGAWVFRLVKAEV